MCDWRCISRRRAGTRQTPQALFDQLDAEFAFATDVCATARTAKCARYFSPDRDGLSQDWAGVCWCNPPYGRAIGDWIRKAYQSSLRGATVVCLVPARTDTAWWHDYVAHGEVRFLRGRITFAGANSPAPFPSAVAIFRPSASDPCRSTPATPPAGPVRTGELGVVALWRRGIEEASRADILGLLRVDLARLAADGLDEPPRLHLP